MKLLRIFSLLVFVLLLAACSNSENDSKGKSTSEKSKTVEQTEIEFTELPTNFYRRLVGTIGDLPITMEFIKMDTVISGSYYYEKMKAAISISGSSRSDINVSFTEFSNRETTGEFSGTFTSESTFTGTWTNPKTQKSLPINLTTQETGITEIKSVTIRKEKCHIADETRNEYEGTVNEADTVCSDIILENLEFNCTDPAIAVKINSAIEKAIYTSGVDPQNSLEEWFATLKKTNYEDGFTIETTVNIRSMYKNILSIAVGTYDYSYYAAHANSSVKILNIDLTTGEIIDIKDLIQPNKEQTFSRAAEEFFESKYGTTEREGWAYEPRDFPLTENYVIQSNGITFIYNPYEIGAWSQGYQSVFIPYRNLRTLIKPEWYKIF